MKNHLVFETISFQSALQEKSEWERMGCIVAIKEKHKVFKGGYTIVYRVWVKPTNIIRCPKCDKVITLRFPYHACTKGGG